MWQRSSSSVAVSRQWQEANQEQKDLYLAKEEKKKGDQDSCHHLPLLKASPDAVWTPGSTVNGNCTEGGATALLPLPSGSRAFKAKNNQEDNL